MATSYRRRAETGGGFSVLGQSVREAIIWAFVAHVVFNTWHSIFPGSAWGWAYGYSLIGLVSWLIDQIVPSQWVPLLVGGLAVIALIVLGFKFFPLIQGAVSRPGHTIVTALIVFGLTLGLFEAVYYGWTSGELYFTPNLVYNTIPPLVVATIIIAGRGSRVYLRETGARDVHDVDIQDDDR